MENRGENESRGKASEEEDLLLRSIDKPKDVTEISMTDVPLTSIVRPVLNNMEKNPDITCSQPGSKQKSSISYRDKVIQLNGQKYSSPEEEDEWSISQREEEEAEDMDEAKEEDDPICPTYRVSKEQHKEDCKQWRKALIIKLLGRKINPKFLMTKLEKQWNLVGSYELITLDNGHLLIRFKEERDYIHVLQDGSWIVVEHYLVVQRWRPLFNPYDEEVRKLAVWVRIPRLPIELYSSQHLWQIGNIFGKTLKIDRSSLRKNEAG
ncbi:uncharacterized protein LOC133283612 [Gastrolobium bilobum]|uniref:uncharacterized protein LOC133283612 n=1 Tax=Gastrolobium bilobum TaxID=150636 RepID=UPI002AB14337|nr:uncharacterized protein LOC133283612 [Gastrolobium bilobum]